MQGMAITEPVCLTRNAGTMAVDAMGRAMKMTIYYNPAYREGPPGLTMRRLGASNVGYAFNPGVMLPPNEKGRAIQDVGGANRGTRRHYDNVDIGQKEPYVGQTILVMERWKI